MLGELHTYFPSVQYLWIYTTEYFFFFHYNVMGLYLWHKNTRKGAWEENPALNNVLTDHFTPASVTSLALSQDDLAFHHMILSVRHNYLFFFFRRSQVYVLSYPTKLSLQHTFLHLCLAWMYFWSSIFFSSSWLMPASFLTIAVVPPRYLLIVCAL